MIEWTVLEAELNIEAERWIARAYDHCGRTLVCRVPSSLGPEAAERGVLAMSGNVSP